MRKDKFIFFILIFPLTFAFALAACSNLLAGDVSSSQSQTAQGLYLVLSAPNGSVIGSSSCADRAAAPKINLDTGSWTFYGALVNHSSATAAADSDLKKIQWDSAANAFFYSLTASQLSSAQTFDLFIYAYPSEPDSATAAAASLRLVKKNFSLSSNSLSTTIEGSLENNTGSTEKGSFSLKFSTPSAFKHAEFTLTKTTEGDSNSYLSSLSTNSNSFTLESVSSGIPAGTYTLLMKFYSAESSGSLLFIRSEKIDIWAGCQTDAWYGSSGAAETLTIADSDLYSTYFVCGTGATWVGGLSVTGNDNAGGGITAPLATVSEAIKRIKALGVETSTIYLDGTVYNQSVIELNSVANLTIKSLSNDTSKSIIDNEGKTNFIITNSSANLVLENITIQNCSVTGSGSCIQNSGKVTVNSCILKNNNSTQYGGAVFNLSGGEITIKNSTINNNSVAGAVDPSGGGIANYGTMTIENSTIKSNTAQTGGGIYNGVGGTLTFESGSVSANTASGSNGGGGVYNKGTFIMKGGSISGNEATSELGLGGGVSNFGTFTMEAGTIGGSSESGGNKAISGSNSMGGGIYNEGASSSFNMQGGSIAYNSASKGGGIGIGSSSKVFISGDASIVSNKANVFSERGGGIYMDSGYLYLGYTDASSQADLTGDFKSNSAADGGGLYISSGALVYMASGLISSNTVDATGNGPDVYVGSDTFTMSSKAKVSYLYLDTGRTIKIGGTSALSESTAAIITPASYTIGTQVLSLASGAGTTIAENYSKFAFGLSSTYEINSSGKLQKKMSAITEADIVAFESSMKTGDIVSNYHTLLSKQIYFKTSNGSYGVMVFTQVNDSAIKFQYKIGSGDTKYNGNFQHNWGCDLDSSYTTDSNKDFGIDGSNPYSFTAYNGAKFYVLE